MHCGHHVITHCIKSETVSYELEGSSGGIIGHIIGLHTQPLLSESSVVAAPSQPQLSAWQPSAQNNARPQGYRNTLSNLKDKIWKNFALRALKTLFLVKFRYLKSLRADFFRKKQSDEKFLRKNAAKNREEISFPLFQDGEKIRNFGQNIDHWF